MIKYRIAMKYFVRVLILLCLFAINLNDCQAQQFFVGKITKEILPINVDKKRDSVVVSYYRSFSGNIKLLLNDSLIYDNLVNFDPSVDLVRGISIKKEKNSDLPLILTIILNDQFYLKELLEFWHPNIRIYYLPNDWTLNISYMTTPPINE